MRHLPATCITAILALSPVLGCESAPRTRPVKMGPVDTGPESIESVRRQLKGTWELIALDLFSPAGAQTAAQATGRLQYDEFGNLSMQGTIAGGQAIDPSVLNLTGRVVIDPATHALRFEAMTASTADERRLDPRIDATRTRYYEFAGDLLKTTVKAADGSTTAIATWKRAS